MSNVVRHVMKGNFIEASSEALSEEEMYRLAGWWVFQGYDVERVDLRTRGDGNDLRLVIARDAGNVVAVVEMVRPGAKEWGWA